MSDWRKTLGVNVYDAAQQRIAEILSISDSAYVSFSGGKDSSAMLHMVVEEARRQRKRVGVLFVDWEAQFKLTIDHVQELLKVYADTIEPYWVALPLKTVNATSMHEPEWICWQDSKKDLWVRPMPDFAISDPSFFDFYKHEMTFEEFVPGFAKWFARRHPGDGPVACFVGIRTQESLNRWRSIARDKATLGGFKWTTHVTGRTYNAYPIYDWKTEDIWTYFGKTGLAYNRLYDRMHQAGVAVSQMRICEPYGDEQRKGLWLFHAIEPQTWSKIVARVAGANGGALYAKEKGNILGNLSIELPDGHSWRSFSQLILDTMPNTTAEHYRDKIAVYLRYCMMHDVRYHNGIPDTQPNDTGSKDVPSWRRICKVLLKNDYWCKGLSFSPTKSSNYQNYKNLMKRRRKIWGM
jgi:predicted phosphoadenosine phosphosulfate sulfurtransferase